MVMVLASAGFIFRGQLLDWYHQKLSRNEDLSGFGQKVTITEGKIPLADFLKFLSNYTGLPVIYDPKDPAILTKDIFIVADIHNADGMIVGEILKTNGYRVYRERLPDGKEVLKIEAIKK